MDGSMAAQGIQVYCMNRRFTVADMPGYGKANLQTEAGWGGNSEMGLSAIRALKEGPFKLQVLRGLPFTHGLLVSTARSKQRFAGKCSFLINCHGTRHCYARWHPCADSFSQPQDAVAVHQKWNGQWKHVIQDWWDCHVQYKLREIPWRVRRLFWTWVIERIDFLLYDILHANRPWLPKGLLVYVTLLQ